jgi:hypothetical protein
MKKKKYPFVTYSEKISSNIIYVEYSKNLKIDLAIAKEIVANRHDFTENKKHYLIINASNVKQVTIEAKKYMQSEEHGLRNIIATAFIASNQVSALIANIFIKTPNVISKFLANEKDALLWIKELKQKNADN